MGAKEQLWFRPRNWALGWSASNSHWIMPAFTVTVAMRSITSILLLVAGFLCEFFFVLFF